MFISLLCNCVYHADQETSSKKSLYAHAAYAFISIRWLATEEVILSLSLSLSDLFWLFGTKYLITWAACEWYMRVSCLCGCHADRSSITQRVRLSIERSLGQDFPISFRESSRSRGASLIPFACVSSNYTGQQDLTFFVPRGNISNPDSTFNAESKYVSSFSPSPTVFFVTAKLNAKKSEKMCIFTCFTGQQNLTFFLAHGGNYLFLIELLTLNSNM
jgi:hypothetical protein